MPNRLIQYALICLLALGLGIAVVWLPEQLKPQAPQNQLLLTEDGCSIKESVCNATTNNQSISVQVNPQEIRSTIPLTFTIELNGIDADAVNLSLEGVDMFMGLNQTQLSPVKDKPGLWRGVTEIAICTTGEMMWRARVTAQQEQQQIEAHFDFSAK